MTTSDLPLLPYAGTSGWSGSQASKDRAGREDSDGTTSSRQGQVLSELSSAGSHGATWKEIATALGWHHGQASGALSILHKEGRISRLARERRLRCSVYVLPSYVRDRPTAPHGVRKGPPPERAILIDLMAGVRAAAEMNSGSAHGRILTAMANHAEAKLREV